MKKILLLATVLLASCAASAQDTAIVRKAVKVSIKPYGFVRNYLNVDSRRMMTVCGGEYLMIPYDEDWNMTEAEVQTHNAADERFDRNAVPEAHFLALSTRFGLALEGAHFMGFDLSGKVEGDFAGFVTNFAFYVPGWMRTRSRDDETWHSFTNVFSGARCERWSWNGDCAWKKAMRNADQAAHGLADEVVRMPDGARTNVTLVGHSLGARIVVRTLAELAGKGLKVKQGILLGAAIPNADPDLERAGKASCLPVLAICNPKDVTLKYAYGAAGGESAPAFGTDGAPRSLENMVECPVSATVTEQTEVEAAWGKSEAIKKIASHHALFYLAALRAILEGDQPEDRQLLVPQGRINVEMKVLDAGIWWDMLETTNGWKLERNKLTGHCRILDPEKKRKAWGSETTMREAFSKLRNQVR